MQSLQELNYQENKKKHDETVLLGKANLNTIEILISKTLTDWCISHEEFVSVNDVLRKHNEIKEELKNPGTFVECTILIRLTKQKNVWMKWYRINSR